MKVFFVENKEIITGTLINVIATNHNAYAVVHVGNKLRQILLSNILVVAEPK